MIYFEIAYERERLAPNQAIILTSSLVKKLDIYQGGDAASSVQRRLYLSKINNTQLKLETYDCIVKVYKIIGIKI